MKLMVEGTIPRGRLKLRWLDNIKVDLKKEAMQLGDAEDIANWRNKIAVPDPVLDSKGM